MCSRVGGCGSLSAGFPGQVGRLSEGIGALYGCVAAWAAVGHVRGWGCSILFFVVVHLAGSVSRCQTCLGSVGCRVDRWRWPATHHFIGAACVHASHTRRRAEKSRNY